MRREDRSTSPPSAHRWPTGAAASAVELALTDVATGESERARERLAGAFASPCENGRPAETHGGDRRVACHLVDDPGA